MKLVTFRPPEFMDEPLVGIAAAEVRDLDEKTLGRLVVEMRHRIMIRDTMLTIERLYWSTSVSMACWTAVLTTAMEELHGRALAEHRAWHGRKLDARLALQLAGRTLHTGDAATRHEKMVRAMLADGSQADNALASERCESRGRTKLMNTPVRCQGATGHGGQHFNGPRVARTWWA